MAASYSIVILECDRKEISLALVDDWVLGD